jgi:hypothetical protein
VCVCVRASVLVCLSERECVCEYVCVTVDVCGISGLLLDLVSWAHESTFTDKYSAQYIESAMSAVVTSVRGIRWVKAEIVCSPAVFYK